MNLPGLTPKEIVAELDRHIIGQNKAKRAVAIALRNRYRRAQLPVEQREEIIPKNILMIGPTGVGKTEIARRLASLSLAPFIKVEATKYTEIGYVGRDVEGMVRDLADYAVRLVRKEKTVEIQDVIEKAVNERLVDLLSGFSKRESKRRRGIPLPPPATPTAPPSSFPFDYQPGMSPYADLSADSGSTSDENPVEDEETIVEQHERIRERTLKQLIAGELEEELVEVDVDEQSTAGIEVLAAHGLEEMGMQLQQMMGDMVPRKKKHKKLPVKEARDIIKSQEIDRRLDMDAIVRIAIKRAEEHGIIFVDEIDKIAGKERGSGPDVSREGVQRDILPLVEGTTVTTKYGPVRTDFILFIAAGAFHMSKPSDLIPEFQGRFPIRVELDSLNAEDFKRILVEPENALTGQYAALLSTEGLTIDFTTEGIAAIAEIAMQVNEQTEDIGARRLSTVLEKVLEEVSFESSDLKLAKIVIDRAYVMAQVADIAKNTDLSRFIL
jgi:ATP-dependent HslUV protease ATP-binding subunit HslU